MRDRRTELLRRSRERFETFATQKYDELGKRKEGKRARFDLSIGPRFPAHVVCEHARLMSALPAINIGWRSVGFPRSTGGGLISQHESAIVLRPVGVNTPTRVSRLMQYAGAGQGLNVDPDETASAIRADRDAWK